MNAHGLTRHIPEDVKYAVRSRCGFGCARCGATVYEYEHFAPDFKDARDHDPDGIVLLCPSCHSLVTKGVIPKCQVAEFSKNPIAKARGFSTERLPIFHGTPTWKFGENGLLTVEVPTPLRVRGTPVINFAPPEEGSNITLLNCMFEDPSGRRLLRVVNNEWQVHDGHWDFQFIGNKYIFKTKGGSALLVLRFNAPHFLTVERMNGSIGGRRIVVDENGLLIDDMSMQFCVVSHCSTAIAIG